MVFCFLLFCNIIKGKKIKLQSLENESIGYKVNSMID